MLEWEYARVMIARVDLCTIVWVDVRMDECLGGGVPW